MKIQEIPRAQRRGAPHAAAPAERGPLQAACAEGHESAGEHERPAPDAQGPGEGATILRGRELKFETHRVDATTK